MSNENTKIEDERLEKFKDSDKPATKQAWRLLFGRYKEITKDIDALKIRIEGVASFAKITDCEVNALMGNEIAKRPHLLGPSPFVDKSAKEKAADKAAEENDLPWLSDDGPACRIGSGNLGGNFDSASKICDNCINAVAVESVDQDSNDAYSVIMCGDKRSGHFNKEMGPTQTCHYFEHYVSDSPYYGWGTGDLDNEGAPGNATAKYITPESQAMCISFDSKGRPTIGAVVLLENEKTKPNNCKEGGK